MHSYLHHLLPNLRAATEPLPLLPEWYPNPYSFPEPNYILEKEQAPIGPLSHIWNSKRSLAGVGKMDGGAIPKSW